MKISWKKIALVIVLLPLLFFVTNIQYFWLHIDYALHGAPAIDQQHIAVENFEPNMLVIESLRIKVPIVYVEDNDEKVFQEALQHGVVHFPGTALPGQQGNAYIFGHSSDYPWAKGNYKTVFALLPKITKNETITITDASGHLFAYKVFETKVVSAGDASVLSQKRYGKPVLTLQTSYPVGTAFQRFIVVAELQ